MSEPERSWIQRVADDVEAAVAGAPAGSAAGTAAEPRIVCASGISPSGPIHLGNLREVMTVHLVVEELRYRGRDAVHLHSWDDYDRFRKVPAGFDQRLAEHVGKPLSAVPDPTGRRSSYADHFIDELDVALTELGVELTAVRQSVRYPRGDYNSAIRTAMARRGHVFDILAGFQTAGRHEASVEERRAAYYPFRPYCEACGTDSTTITGYDEATGSFDYRCRCGHAGSGSLADGATISGKLAWKVDWPMRWVHEGVAFEPAGVDHHSPTSSFASGAVIAKEIYGGAAPHSLSYAFVGLAGGSSKISGSAGTAAVPATALEVLEPAVVRWLYARRTPGQSFDIDLSPRAIQRLYDEWDQFLARTEDADPRSADGALRRVSTTTSSGPVAMSQLPVSFRLLASLADLTQANREQLGRLLARHLAAGEPGPAAAVGPAGRGGVTAAGVALDPAVDQARAADLLTRAEPRASRAVRFATTIIPPQERTVVREAFSRDAWDGLDEELQHAARDLAAGLAAAHDLDSLTALVYAVPKGLLGLPADAEPTPEVKRAQRRFFAATYQLLCGADTGPRLPTLLLSIGPERARSLLVPPAPPPPQA